MTNTDFEALGLRHGDRIWIQEANGQCNWGRYLEGYDSEAQTFVFGADRGAGPRLVVDLAAVQNVER
jgi:anaerobic selenocysteine-containing dehydrogenase